MRRSAADWIKEAHAGGVAARVRWPRRFPDERFRAWYGRRRRSCLHRIRAEMEDAFRRGWLEEDAKHPAPARPPEKPPAEQPLTLAQKRDRISSSIGLFVIARFDPARTAVEAWAEWADVNGIGKAAAERARREFAEAWNGRPGELADLAEMEGDE